MLRRNGIGGFPWAMDERPYRHWFNFGRRNDAEGLFCGYAGARDCSTQVALSLHS